MLKPQTPDYIRFAKDVRSIRDSRLMYTDWTQVADAPVNKEAWAAYRQALRDVTQQEGFPMQVEWPVPPMQAAPAEQE
jgi:hypothetical protein